MQNNVKDVILATSVMAAINAIVATTAIIPIHVVVAMTALPAIKPRIPQKDRRKK